ncbi:MAG TPA: GNAT family N-acetyltransferase [Terriglobales bacterium]|nr:GNAT family N-acetyltransferase [Terriglobales bacterium]
MSEGKILGSRIGAGLEIRPADLADIPRLAVLYATAHGETYAPIFGAAYVPLAVAATETVCAGFFGDSNVVLLARSDGADAGFLYLAAGHLELLYLLQAYQGRGIGRVLMRQALAAAAQRGRSEITFNVLPANTGAIRFYESLGAARIGSVICQHETGPFEDWVFRLAVTG